MKLKRFICFMLSVVFAVPLLVMPSAAVETIIFSNGEDKIYALEIRAEQMSANIDLKIGDSISLSHYKGSSVTLNGSSRSYFGRITEATFQGGELTSGNTSCQIFGGENRFVPGLTNRFTWTGTIVLNDSDMHPEKDLGINMNGSFFTIEMRVFAASLTNTLTTNLPIASARVIQIDNDKVISGGSSIVVRDYINNSMGFTAVQRTKIKNGRDFRITVNLDEPISTNSVFSFNTDLNSSNIQTIANRGDRRVVFDAIPSHYFYDAENSVKFGTEIIFERMRVTGGINYRNVQLTFTEGTGTSSTTTGTGTTATTNKSGVYEAEPEPDVNTAYINYSTVTLNPGASVMLKTDIDTAGLKYTTTGRDVCRVFTSGRIEAVNPGTATIAITNNKGEKVNCVVTVKASATPLISFSLNTTNGTVYKNHSYTLARFSRSPATTTDTINWSTSNPKIATVTRNGAVTIVGTGTVEITALTSGGLSSTARLTARNPFVTISNGITKTLKVGNSYTINARKGPTSSILSYSSSKSSVAKVDNSGKVTAVSKGTATITVRSNKGPTQRINITVN